jgi:eukaryotic-like serine/threonine-protein kinase
MPNANAAGAGTRGGAQSTNMSSAAALGANASWGAARGASESGAAVLNANPAGAGNISGGALQGTSANTSNTAAPLRQPPAQQLHQPALATAGLAAGGGGANIAAERPLWETIQLENVPRSRVARLEPMRRRRWPIVLLGVLAGIAVAVFYWLPRYAPQGVPIELSALSQHMSKSLAPATAPSTSPPDEATAATASGADNSAEAKLQATRENFDRRLAALEARGAGVWGGAEFAMAKTRAAESVGAHDAGNTQMAQDRLADASHLLDEVESKAPQALAAQLAAGQKALAAGQEEVANHAFEIAKQIDPNDRRIADGQRRVQNLGGVLPLLADAQNAESARNYSRAAQDYSQVLALDPGNDKARSGLARANAASGDDNYAKAVGSGFAALGAGRLDDARAAFQKARALRPNGSEAADGLRRVGAALSAKGYASVRQRAWSLEAQERWDEAVQLYDSALQSDPSLAFAQEGKDRAAARAELAASMQALIDRPERLSSQSVRNQAKALLDTAHAQSPSGPVLRSQIARLGMLLPDYDSSAWRGTARTDLLEKPVRLSLVSDNATAISIPSIGQFGTFSKRDIDLKPGRYTVIGTRDGYRDIRRDITISPGQESQTISVSCSDPI